MDRQAIKPNNVKQADAFPRTFFQPRLTINQPNDVYEQEAVAIADKFMRMAEPATNESVFLKPLITRYSVKARLANNARRFSGN